MRRPPGQRIGHANGQLGRPALPLRRPLGRRQPPGRHGQRLVVHVHGPGQLGADLLEPGRPVGPAQPEQVRALRRVQPGRLGRGGGRRADLGLGLGPGRRRLPAALLQLGGDPVVQLGPEQPGQQPPPLVVIAAQELGELALRQQHDLRELLPAEPDGLGDQLADLGLVRRQADPAAILLALQVDLHGLR